MYSRASLGDTKNSKSLREVWGQLCPNCMHLHRGTELLQWQVLLLL